MECSKSGCIKPVFAIGLCHSHYDAQRAIKAQKCGCSGCDLPIHAKGLCSKHYRREIKKLKEPCSVEGCGRPIHGNGLCSAHHTRLLRHGHLEPTRANDWGAKTKHPLYESWCWIRKKRGKINIEKEWIDDFWIFVKDIGERPDKKYKLRLYDESLGYIRDNAYWKEPVSNDVKAQKHKKYQADYVKAMRETNPQKFANYDYKRKYGITLDEYNEMFSHQNGVCAICGSPEKALNPKTKEPRRLALDHCHESGNNRGLLCTGCNIGLGKFKDSTDTLKKAIEYLEKHSNT